MIKINDKLRPLYEENTRYYIITGERGSSKSFSVADYLTRKLYQKNQIIYFTRYTMESATDSIIPEFEEKIELLNAENHFKVLNRDVYNLLSGSEMKFRGVKASQGSQTAKLKGLTNATVWVIDEAEEFVDENMFDKLNKSLRGKNKDGTERKFIIIFILNPTYKTHFIYKRFFKDANVPDNSNIIKNNVTYIHLTWKDNKDNLDKDFIAEAVKLETENPEKYKRVYSTGWLNPEQGLLYPKFKIENYTPKKDNQRIAYIDTADAGKDNYSMPIVELSNGNAYLIDVIYNKSRLVSNEILTVELINKLNIDIVIIETNKEGGLYVNNIKKQTKAKIIGIHNSTKKETRILSQRYWLIDHLIIKPENKRSKEYHNFIEDALSYEIEGKNLNDDAPDSLSGLSKFLRISLKM